MVQAQAAGKDITEYVYDFLLEDGGRTFAIVLGSNYLSGNHDVIHTMLTIRTPWPGSPTRARTSISSSTRSSRPTP